METINLSDKENKPGHRLSYIPKDNLNDDFIKEVEE